MLREALSYVRLGLSVVPLKPLSKEPLLNWKEFQSRRASEDEVKEWLTKWPDMNIGLVTGNVSQIAIVDLDGPEGIKECESLGIKSTTVSLTGNGRHLWYRNQDGIGNSVRQYPGIDVRGEGGFIVAPGSVHANGKRYRWLTIPVRDVLSLPPFPGSLFAAPVMATGQAGNEPGWIAKALEEMTNGNIDITLFKICSKLRNDGYTETDALILLSPHADRAGAEAGHLEDKIKNVWGRYEPKQSQVFNGLRPAVSLVLHSPGNQDSINEYDKRRQLSSSSGEFATGYPKLDTLTKGLRRGELFTVAARTGVGKTNFVLGPIRTFCENGKKVILFSTEMSFDQIWSRYIETLTDKSKFNTHQFYICDEFTPNPERIEEAIRQMMPDLFVFDHINHVGTEHHELSKFMMSLKELARRFNIPGIVTAQLNRAADWVEKGERVSPRLSMIKGSGSIEEISAQVLLLSEKRVHDGYTEIEGILDKNRHGDKGQVMFGLFKAPYQMREL